MARSKEQHENCRSRYTKEAIKAALLEMMRRQDFQRISVTQLCRKLDISRSTFYLHYYDTYDVLDDLIQSVLENTSGIIDHVLYPGCAACSYSLCQQFQQRPECRPLLTDPTAFRRIQEKLTLAHRGDFTSYLVHNSCLTPEQADALFYFQINGCLVTNRMMLETRKENWPEIQQVIDQYIKGGLESHLVSR